MQALFCPFFKMTALAGHLWEDADPRANICGCFAEDGLGEKNVYKTSDKGLVSFKSRYSHQQNKLSFRIACFVLCEADIEIRIVFCYNSCKGGVSSDI